MTFSKSSGKSRSKHIGHFRSSVRLRPGRFKWRPLGTVSWCVRGRFERANKQVQEQRGKVRR